MRVAILCEFSGIVRDAFIRRGHDAISCDLLPTEAPGPHIQGDCLARDWSSYDLLICHPPCTYLCNSGVRWLWNRDGTKNDSRWRSMQDAIGLFGRCLVSGPRVACENPIMHCHARVRLGKPDQTVQPWQFGHPETKATCLWLRGLPRLVPTNVVAGRTARIHRMAPGPMRSHLRSITYRGIADAMAEQWGGLAREVAA